MNEQRFPIEQVRSFTERALVSVGAQPSDAQVVADVLVEADMRGIFSHGISRLFRYVNAVKNGEVDVTAVPEVLDDRGAVARVDAHDGFGQVAGVFAMDQAMQRARQFGIGMVTVSHSSHYGIAGYYAERAMPDMIGVAFTNTAPLVVPTLGKQAVLGTNPIAVAAPKSGDPWLMDFSTSATSRGKIEVCNREGRPLDPRWAVDEKGETSTDPSHVLHLLSNRLNGGINPMAEYKGYGLAAMVELFSGILSGSAFGLDVHREKKANVGHCFLAINVGAFMPREAFIERMDAFCAMMTQSPAEEKTVYLHGEQEYAARARSLESGIVVKPETQTALRAVAELCGLDPM